MDDTLNNTLKPENFSEFVTTLMDNHYMCLLTSNKGVHVYNEGGQRVARFIGSPVQGGIKKPGHMYFDILPGASERDKSKLELLLGSIRG